MDGHWQCLQLLQQDVWRVHASLGVWRGNTHHQQVSLFMIRDLFLKSRLGFFPMKKAANLF